MSEDARFEDGGETPLRLSAEDTDDLAVISSLVQDAVLPVTEIYWDKPQRRFSFLINRFRWEDKSKAKQRGRALERVQSVLVIEDALRARSQGVDRSDKDIVLSILSIDFEPGEDGTGCLTVTLAGDGLIEVGVEALSVKLKDVTRPYIAPSGKAPEHGA